MRATFLFIFVLLLSGSAGPATQSAAPRVPAGVARKSARVEPKAGWEPECDSKLSRAVNESWFGAFAGLMLVAIPALALGLTRFRALGVALAICGAIGGAMIVGWLYWGIAPEPVCGSWNSPADIDAHMNSDSLYFLWRRFSVSSDTTELREVSHAIECEQLRLSLLEPWGVDAIRLAHSRLATPAEFETMRDRFASINLSPEPHTHDIGADSVYAVKCLDAAREPLGGTPGAASDQSGRPAR